MALEKLATFQQLEQMLQDNDMVLLLKNSITCPVSHEAYRQYEKLADEINNEVIYYLNVQEARPLSTEIAEKFSVKHESPQVLLFKNGILAWHASHWDITYQNLKDQFRR